MTRGSKIILIVAMAFFVWIAGIWLIYEMTWTPKRNVAGVMIVQRPMKRLASGEFKEMSFIEANALYLLLLTGVCGGVTGLVVSKLCKKREQPDVSNGDVEQ